MGNKYFLFKQFSVNQDDVSMKVNTDGVLLGAWCPLDCISENTRRGEAAAVLDIGTGTGVIALMMAQRLGPPAQERKWDLRITAIDIDGSSCIRASENFATSKWAEVLECKHISLQEHARVQEKKYNLIISNPPYFSNSLKASGKRRNDARHNDSLPYDSLISDTVLLLQDSGSFVVILPYAEFSVFSKMASGRFLFARRICEVYAKQDSQEPKRIMAEFVKGLPKNTLKSSLAIQNNEGLTPEYKAITKDFYL